MKNKKNTVVSSEAVETTTEVVVVAEPTMTVTEPKKLGRPSNPNSARQARLKAIAERQVNGAPIKLGRPTVAGSKRQQKLDEIAAKKAAGIVASKGRPKMTEEQKAEAKAKRDAEYAIWQENQAKLAAERAANAGE